MPKMKTRKAIAKRVKITAGGKVLRNKPGVGHLKSRKTPKQLRRLRKKVQLPATFAKHAKRLLGK